MKFKNKVVIVTGASSGIGLALAELLSSKGANIALVARSKNTLQKISKRLPDSAVFAADITKEKQIGEMIRAVKKHFGRIDILINCAGQGYDAPIEKTDTAVLQKIFELDVLGPIIAMQKVIPIMKRQKKGFIVNISSGTALMYLANMGGYSGLKRALANITLTARNELKKYNISASVVYPYITLTNFEKNTIKAPGLSWEGGGGSIRPPDSAEFIAKKIIDGIKKNKAEIFAHAWMEKITSPV